MGSTRILILSLACMALISVVKALSHEPELGSARVVFQTSYGDIEFGSYLRLLRGNKAKVIEDLPHYFKTIEPGLYGDVYVDDESDGEFQIYGEEEDDDD